jgi:hypothetical protein
VGFFTRDGGEPVKPKTLNEARRATNGMTASARRIDLKKSSELEALKKRRDAGRWQTMAWEYYDVIPEVKFSANLIANVASRIRLYPAFVDNQDSAPSEINGAKDVSDDLKQAAYETLRLLETGNGGIPGVIRDACLNLFIAGECYLVREEMPDSFGVTTWQVRSVDEIIVNAAGRDAGVAIKPTAKATAQEYIPLSSNAYFGRIWRTHPRYSDEADSSMRGLLELCDQLLLNSRAARGIAKSRLNAGILFLPDELSNGSQADGETEESEANPNEMAPLADDDSDAFEEELIDSLITPIADESSASAVVPYLVRGPAEVGPAIRHITFDRLWDPQITKDSETTLDRILAGLDIPKDIVAGLANAKYANAVAVEESLLKAHIEPLILMIIDALTVVLMRPVLRSLGYEESDISKVVIWYDPSAITTKPDKATAATTGYEMETLSAEAWRRANGFSETDAPSDLEIAQRLALSKGLISEPIMEALLYTIMPELLGKVREQQQSLSSPETEAAVEQAVADPGATPEPPSEPETPSTPTPGAGPVPGTPLMEP